MALNKNSRIFPAVATFVFVLWWGGFTFYSAFVVPIGMDVLGSHILMGFITQQVTVRLNITGAIAIILAIIYVGNFYAETRKRKWLNINLYAMLILLIGLFVLHYIMDGYLDPTTRHLSEEHQFYKLHRMYLIISTVMWLQGIVHVYFTTVLPKNKKAGR